MWQDARPDRAEAGGTEAGGRCAGAPRPHAPRPAACATRPDAGTPGPDRTVHHDTAPPVALPGTAGPASGPAQGPSGQRARTAPRDTAASPAGPAVAGPDLAPPPALVHLSQASLWPGPLPDPARPVLLAGPTASGKTALALDLARRQDRAMVNADALQVFADWRVLSARPAAAALAGVRTHLFGHVAWDAPWSAGHWLRAVAALLPDLRNPVIVGGTGLYFSALTEGLAEIPDTPPAVRAAADEAMRTAGAAAMLADLDAETAARIDPANPARIQRAWEVQRATGTGLAAWQRRTAAPLLPPGAAETFVLDAPRDWLAARIDRRFAAMLAEGALDEVRAVLPRWNPRLPAARAIGAPELVAHLRGTMTLAEAEAAATLATRRYAKRQRTWARNRMAGWTRLPAPESAPDLPPLGDR